MIFGKAIFLKMILKTFFLITTGNIKNRDLLRLFDKNWTEIEAKLLLYAFLEMDNIQLIAH